MTTIFDDKILQVTSNWRFTNDIVRKIGGDKSAIINRLKRLEEMNYLETKPDKNKSVYKKMNKAQSEYDFLKMMEVFETNQKTELNVIKQMPRIMMNDGIHFRKKGLELLEHIQEEVVSAYMIIIRLNNQEKSSIISHSIVIERKERLEKYIEKIMNFILNRYNEKKTVTAIQEYFQKYIEKFEIKI